MLDTTKKGNYKSQNLDNFDKKYLVNNEEAIKILDIRYIISIRDLFISEHTIFT